MNISRMFYTLAANEKISKEEMTACGITEYYIQYFIENEILKVIDDSSYGVGNLEALMGYGRNILQKGDEKTAFSIFNCVLAIDYENYDINLLLLYSEIKSEKPRRGNVFKYFDAIYKALVNSGRECDANYYLFILGSLCGFRRKYDDKIGERISKYEKIFNQLKANDVLLPFSDNNAYYKNMLRKRIFANLYHEVDITYSKTLPYDENDFDKVFERDLVIEWLKNKKYVNRKIREYLKDDEIEEARDFLEKFNDRRSLTISNQYILKILNDYLEIQETGEIPVSTYDGNNAFEAINGNNYKLALELENDWIKEHGGHNNYYILLALKKIIALIDSLTSVEFDVQVLENTKEDSTVEPSKNSNFSLTEDEKKSISEKLEKLHKGREIFLLEPMPKEKRDKVRKFISEKGYTDVTAFAIGIEPNRQIYLRYKPVRTGARIDFRDLYAQARKAYSEEKNNEAAECYQTIIQIGKPNEFAFSGYGMALYRLRRINEAIDCLKISTILSQTEGTGVIDYTDFIEKLIHPRDKVELKPKVVMGEDDFVDNNKSEDDETITVLIDLMEVENLSLVDACKKLSLSEETTNYYKLRYARECYYNGYDNLGDMYLKQVEKSKAKDEKVKALLKKIQINKKYYRNRSEEEKNQLVFIKKRK